MQDYLIVKGQINPIETENALEVYKLNEWTKLDPIVRATTYLNPSTTKCNHVRQLRNFAKEGCRHQDIFDLTPLQPSYERI